MMSCMFEQLDAAAAGTGFACAARRRVATARRLKAIVRVDRNF
jgi:hypothetical protein